MGVGLRSAPPPLVFEKFKIIGSLGYQLAFLSSVFLTFHINIFNTILKQF